ncbi:MAG: hypothetical protein L6R39_004339 [Caloplaca ligustica]|nr:MAG: hypothetical protein L6R39_004339 [Caloplaca ligustica]
MLTLSSNQTLRSQDHQTAHEPAPAGEAEPEGMRQRPTSSLHDPPEHPFIREAAHADEAMSEEIRQSRGSHPQEEDIADTSSNSSIPGTAFETIQPGRSTTSGLSTILQLASAFVALLVVLWVWAPSAAIFGTGLGTNPATCNYQGTVIWKLAQETQPLLLSRQLRFSKLGFESLHDRVRGFDIAFDRIPETLRQGERNCTDLEASVMEYSKEAGILFEWMDLSATVIERGLRLSAPKVPGCQTSPLDTYVEVLRLKVYDVLTVGHRVRDQFFDLDTAKMRLSNQLESVDRTLWGMYVDGVKRYSKHPAARQNESFYLESVQRTRASYKTLSIGYAKVDAAVASAMRSFDESLADLESLNRTIDAHASGPIPPFNATQMATRANYAKKVLASWAEEDSRHEEWLFRSPTERVQLMYKPLAAETIR